MPYEIEEREEPMQTILTIGATCKATEIGLTLGRILPEVGQYVGESGAVTVGPPFCRYIAMDAETWEIEGGIAVAAPVAETERVKVGQMGGKVVRTVHTGPYDKLGKAHEALYAWIEANGREIVGPAWELYITDPGALPNPEDWQTVVSVPIR